MVKSPEERENSLRRSLSQSDGDTPRGLDANAEVQQRAMQRYHRLLKTDPQLQVMHQAKLQAHLSLIYVPAFALFLLMFMSSTLCCSALATGLWIRACMQKRNTMCLNSAVARPTDLCDTQAVYPYTLEAAPWFSSDNCFGCRRMHLTRRKWIG